MAIDKKTSFFSSLTLACCSFLLINSTLLLAEASTPPLEKNLPQDKKVTQHQSAHPNKTRSLAKGQTSPSASLQQLSWLTGHWRGELDGAIIEEVWGDPIGDSMVAAFKQVKNGRVVFYEIEVIRQIGDSLILQLKHFTDDLKGWEKQNETVDFPLVAIEDNAVYFDGFTIERVSPDQITMHVRISQGETVNELSFVYHRVKP